MGAPHSLIRNITCDGACRREDRDQPPCRASERHIDRAGQARPIKREPREEGRARGTGKSGQGRGGGGGQGCLMPARLSKEQGAGSERPRPRKAEQERAREEGREEGELSVLPWSRGDCDSATVASSARFILGGRVGCIHSYCR